MTTGGRQYTSRRSQDELAGDNLASKAAALVDERRLRSSVETLSGFGPRHSGASPDGHREASAWIESELRSYGYKVETTEFEIPGQSPARSGLNVTGAFGAIEGPVTLLGAHYDTVPRSPGADDNASGVAVMLECARIIAALPHKPSVIFAAFDAEENQPPEGGLHGSRSLAQSFKAYGVQVAGAYILEMVGFSAPKGGQRIPNGLQMLFPRAFDMLRESEFAGDSLVAITNAKSRWMGRKLEQAANDHSESLKILPMELPGWLKAPRNLLRSDHAPFWEVDIPAVMIGDTANFRNPNYHQPSDTPDTLDYGLIADVTRALSSVLAKTPD